MKAYIELLIWTMLFVLVIEMIFPSSDLKKYLKLVLGFIVVYTILSPLLTSKWIGTTSYEEYVKYYAKQLTVDTRYEEEVVGQMQSTGKFYEEQLEKTLKNTIQEQLDVQVTAIDVVVRNQDLEVENVYLTVVENRSSKEIFIPCIKIGEKTESMGVQESNTEKEIKNCLKNFYNLKTANIHITVQEN